MVAGPPPREPSRADARRISGFSTPFGRALGLHRLSDGRRVSAADGDLFAGRVVGVRRGSGGPEVLGPLRLERGALHETLILVGAALEELPPGTRLRVGDGAVVELTGEAGPSGGADGCGGLRTGPGDAPRIAARVVEPGTVRVGDPVGLEAVRVPLEDAFDLHPFRPDEIADVVREYVEAAHAAGLGEVRVIHGRGRGVQREAVRRVLATLPLVAAFADAPPQRGGWGATVVRLRLTSRPPLP